MNPPLISESNIVSRITLIDGISIFFIVLFHEFGGLNRPDSLFLCKYLAIFGLVLFTFSSGFKMIFNHSDELDNKSFLTKYFIKRFVRLYKAYIGYTILAFIPFYFITYLSTYYLKLNFEGFRYFLDSLSLSGFLYIIIGDNFVAYQLWYLIALIVITFVCFTVLYYFNLSSLFYLCLLLTLFDFIYWDNLKTYSIFLFNVMVYMPVYIFGIFFGYKKLYSNYNKFSYFCSIIFCMLFLLSILDPMNTLLKYNILLYGFTLSPLMILFSSILLKNNYVKKPLLICGNYSFQIYMFHWPLILPLLSRFTIDILNLNSFIIPYLITILAIIVCISAYKTSKKIKLNRLFE